MPPVAQVRPVIFNDEEIGMGFNSQSGRAVGTALEGFQLQEPTASGQEVVASISIVTTHEELMEQLGMSFAAQGRYGFFTASAKASFAESSNFNSTSTFIVARCVVQNPMTRGRGFTLTHDAAGLLDPANIERFKTAFGDSFVRGLQTGGEFYAVTRITSTSVATQSKLSASLHAAYNGLITSLEFDAE